MGDKTSMKEYPEIDISKYKITESGQIIAQIRKSYKDLIEENEQLKADLEHHKQSELATGKLLLAEKQKTESLQAQIEKMKCYCSCEYCKFCDNEIVDLNGLTPCDKCDKKTNNNFTPIDE